MGKSAKTVGPSPQEYANDYIAAKSWNDYQTRFVPLENMWMKDISSDATPTINKVAGQVNADAAQQAAATANTVPGVDPSSGSFQSAIKNNQAAIGVGQAQTSAINKTKNWQAGNLQNAINLGRGQATTAQAGLGQLAQGAEQNNLYNAEQNYISNRTMANTVGAGIGTVSRLAMGNSGSRGAINSLATG